MILFSRFQVVCCGSVECATYREVIRHWSHPQDCPQGVDRPCGTRQGDAKVAGFPQGKKPSYEIIRVDDVPPAPLACQG